MHANDLVSKRIGFGCGRLQGGMEKNSSIRLIHTALDLGIRHFDVAPSYGMGSAEQILGEALTGCNLPLTVATKVGISRPQAPSTLQALRAVIKPLSRVIPGLRSVALNTLVRYAAPHNFDINFIKKSFRQSLALLRRSSVDFLLLHEPGVDLDLPPIQDLMSTYVDQGFISNYGSSTGLPFSGLVPFGTVAQYRCPALDEDVYSNAEIEILHGAYRFAAPHIASAVRGSDSLRAMLVDTGVLIDDQPDSFGAIAIVYVLAHSRGRVLVSTTSANRLVNTLGLVRQIVQSPHWQSSMRALKGTVAPQLVVKEAV